VDKVVLKFIADILYIKGIILFEELEAIYEAKSFSDLDTIVKKIEGGEYRVFRGETYNIIEPKPLPTFDD